MLFKWDWGFLKTDLTWGTLNFQPVKRSCIKIWIIQQADVSHFTSECTVCLKDDCWFLSKAYVQSHCIICRSSNGFFFPPQHSLDHEYKNAWITTLSQDWGKVWMLYTVKTAIQSFIPLQAANLIFFKFYFILFSGLLEINVLFLMQILCR